MTSFQPFICNRVSVLILGLLGAFSVQATVIDTQAIYNQAVLAHQIQGSYPDSAYAIAQEMERVSMESNYQEGIAFAHMRMGYLDNIRGRNTRAKWYMNSVIDIRKDLQDYEGAAYACITLSYIYQNTGFPDSAFLVMYNALKYQEPTQNEALLGSIHLQLAYLGSIYNHDENEIIAHFEKAKSIAKSHNDTTALIELYSQWGSFYTEKDQFDKALSLFLKVADLISDQSTLITNNNNLALCYVELKAFEVASNYYHENLTLSKTLHFPLEEATSYINLGVLHHRLLQADSSEHYYLKALEIYQITNNKVEIAGIYERLAASNAQKEDYEQALAYHVKFTELSEEIINEERVSSIAEMQVKYDTHQKELALQLSLEEEKTQKAQKNVFIVGSLVLALLLLIAILVFIQKQRVNKKNRLLQERKMKGVLDAQELKTYQAMMQGQEEERLRISADLHDRLGSMLSTVKLLFSGLEDKLDRQQESNQTQYDTAKNIIDDACTEIRRISHNLGAGMVANFGLENAIHELCDSISQSDTLHCKFISHSLPENIPLKVETELYRIVQETFNNVIKHAQASEINIQLNGHSTEINLIIEDNGVGFDSANKKITNGLGLQSIKNRVSLLAGTCHLDTVKGRGTTFIIDIPINWTND